MTHQPKISRRRIRDLAKWARESGDASLATLCEIALGGSGPLSKLAMSAVEQKIRFDSPRTGKL